MATYYILLALAPPQHPLSTFSAPLSVRKHVSICKRVRTICAMQLRETGHHVPQF